MIVKVELVTHSIIPNLKFRLVPIDPVGLVYPFFLKSILEPKEQNIIFAIYFGNRWISNNGYEVTIVCSKSLVLPISEW